MKSFKEILGIQEEEKPIPINASEGVALKEQLAEEEEEIVSSPVIGQNNSVLTQDGMMTPGMMTRKQRRYLFNLLGLKNRPLSKIEQDRRAAGVSNELKRRKKFRKKNGLKIK